ELYPTRIRAQAIGFVYSWSRFSAIFSGFIIAFFLGNYGTIGVFGLIGSAMIAVFIVIGFFGPPVPKRRLEAVAALFLCPRGARETLLRVRSLVLTLVAGPRRPLVALMRA